MMVDFFVRGLIIGFSIAAVVGPIGLLCIHRTLHKGFLYGLVTGLGAATADGLYGSIAAFGLSVIALFLVSQHIWIHLVGGLFLIYLGIKTLLTKPAEHAARAEAHNFVGAYASTLLLTLTNPLTILSFTAIFAGLGVGSRGIMNSSPGVTNDLPTFLPALIVVCGVFLGSALWWLLLSSTVTLLRKKFSPLWLIWVNRLSGSAIALFGVFALLSLRG